MSDAEGVTVASRLAAEGLLPPVKVAEPGARQGAAGAAELRQVVRASLIGLFGPFLKKLPQAIAEWPMPPGADGLRLRIDLIQALNDGARLWLETYIRQVDAHLLGGVEFQPLSGSDGGDDFAAVSRMELRAEARCKALVHDLNQRLGHLRDSLYVPLYTGALAPAGLCRALHETAAALGWPATHRGMLFELFDLLVVRDLERFYRMLLSSIAHVHVTMSAAEPAEAAPAARATPRKQRRVDDETKAMLRDRAQGAANDSYNDGSLASDLLKLAEEQLLPGVSAEQQQAPLQRMSLAGQFLNQAVTDPLVPKEMRPQHETLRFPLVKSALADASLFTSAQHPLAGLVNEMALKAATARITGDTETRLNVQRLQELLLQFDLSPEFVRAAMVNQQPLSDTQIQWFFELQQRQAELRRQTVINEARQRVLRELEKSTFGRSIPPQALHFLKTAWGPLLVKRLFENGADHYSWRSGLAFMDKLLDLIEARDPTALPTPEWGDLVDVMVGDLAAAGFGAAALSTAVTELEAARQTPPQR